MKTSVIFEGGRKVLAGKGKLSENQMPLAYGFVR